MQKVNHHCSVVIIGNNCILIEGASGSGKTCLAMGLIETFNKLDIESTLVSDDQAILNVDEGSIIAIVPNSIAGKVEIRGFGIVSMAHIGRAKITLVVSLEEDEGIERMPEAETKTLLGIKIPYLKLPIRHEAQAIRIVKAWLDNKPSIL